MLWIYLTGLDRHMKDIVHLSYRSYQRRQYRCCGDLRYKITRLGGGEGRGRGRRTCFKIESLSKWSVQFLQSSTLSSHNLTVSFIGYFSLSLSLFQSPPPSFIFYIIGVRNEASIIPKQMMIMKWCTGTEQQQLFSGTSRREISANRNQRSDDFMRFGQNYRDSLIDSDVKNRWNHRLQVR